MAALEIDAPVNPTQLDRNVLSQEIGKDTTHLADLRLALKAFVDNAQLLRIHRTRFVDLLVRLRDQLAIHFTLKEAGGYLGDIVQKNPRLAEPVENLKAEHSQLFQTACELVEQAEAAAHSSLSRKRLPRLLKQLQAFEFALQQHEGEEKQLVFEAVDRDIGGQG